MNEFSDPTQIRTVKEYVAAFLYVRDDFKTERPFNESVERRLLQEHYAAPNHTSTSARLAESVGLSSYSAVNLRYGTYAGRVAAALNYRPGPFTTGTPGDPHWWRTLAFGNDGVPVTESGEYEWVMRPEVCQALEQMGWVKRPE